MLLVSLLGLVFEGAGVCFALVVVGGFGDFAGFAGR